MSKASEWAKVHARPRVTIRRAGTGVHRDDITADVLDDGTCRVIIARPFQTHTESTIMSPGEALTLARWILDTFGDAPQAPERSEAS